MPRGWLHADGKPVIWEACQTLNGSWGYDRDNLDWKDPDLLIRMIADAVSKGGNILLNVGPTGRGEFDPRALDTLADIGEWMRLHGRAIYGCTQAPFSTPPDCRYTYNPATTASTCTSSPGRSSISIRRACGSAWPMPSY